VTNRADLALQASMVLRKGRRERLGGFGDPPSRPGRRWGSFAG
jgi:hypothetical protein